MRVDQRLSVANLLPSSRQICPSREIPCVVMGDQVGHTGSHHGDQFSSGFCLRIRGTINLTFKTNRIVLVQYCTMSNAEHVFEPTYYSPRSQVLKHTTIHNVHPPSKIPVLKRKYLPLNSKCSQCPVPY